ncbi:hypothetical protein MPER_03360 [Moniliophthora perniciosa FA553]|nr:hypothetical protein MPER_03360 [Moniliophthora perniciosa FA553]
MLTAAQVHFENPSPQTIKLNGSSDAVSPRLIDKLSLGGIASDGNFRRAPGPSAKPNIALWVTKDHQIYQEEVPYPVCGPDDCIVHIHFWKSGRIGDCTVDHDLILGHESSGEILKSV